MSTNQADKGKVKPCPNGCGKDIFFESRFGEDGKLITKDDGKTKWYMMEDASKQLHKCPNKGKPFTKSQETKPDYSKFKPEFVNDGELQIWNDIIAKSAEYAILAQMKLDEYPEIQNPALKGLITKSAFEVLFEMKRRDSDGS